VLLDPYGRELVRRKQYGLVTGPLEYVLADPPAARQLVDAIGDTIAETVFGFDSSDDEEQDDEE